MARTVEGSVSGKEALAVLESYGPEEDATDALLKNKDLLAKLDQVQSAKADKFKRAEADFWKPQKVGDFLQGIYLGSTNRGRYLVHAIGKKDAKGRPFAVRLNGTAILTRELKRGEVGQGVRIEWKGEGKTDAGQRLQMYEVSWLDN